MNKTVAILKRVIIDDKPRYCTTIATSNGKIRADTVMFKGQEIRYPGGCYYLSFYEGEKQIRVAVGKEVSGALIARDRKRSELDAKNNGVEIVETKTGSPSLAYAIEQYLEDIKGTKKPKTLAAYRTALNYFTESCHKVNIADIERRDLLRFVSYLRDEKDQSPRSVYNKFEAVISFLKKNGIRGIVEKNDWPKYTEETPEIYEDEELAKLFATSDDEERLWYQFFLTTGMREQEVMYCYWRDISFAHSAITVSHKPDYGWSPKAYKEREIPLPESLLRRLKIRKEKADCKCPLIFPTAGCKPKLDFLDCLKSVAERAGMNADHFWLHKFRATYATKSLCGGTDVRTVQSYLGHSDLESTLRYLKPSRSPEVRDKVNHIFEGVLA
jgi:integrase